MALLRISLSCFDLEDDRIREVVTWGRHSDPRIAEILSLTIVEGGSTINHLESVSTCISNDDGVRKLILDVNRLPRFKTQPVFCFLGNTRF